jgi:hypothetical protein
LTLRLALLAILVGGPIVAVEIAALGAASLAIDREVPLVLVIGQAILSTLLLTALGTTFFGPFVALATIPAAAIWAYLLRRHLARTARF